MSTISDYQTVNLIWAHPQTHIQHTLLSMLYIKHGKVDSHLVRHLEPGFAGMIITGSVEQRIGLCCGKAPKHDGLSVLLCMA